MTGMTPVVRLIVVSVALMASMASADAQSLNGQNVTVTLIETLPIPYSNVSDTVTAGPGGPQIVGNPDFTKMPPDPNTKLGTEVLQSGESVTLQGLSIVAVLKGDGGPYLGLDPGCSGGCSTWDTVSSNATYLFSGLSFGTPDTILTGVDISTRNIYGVPTVMDLTPTSFEVEFGAAGIPNGSGGNQAFGTITMDLETAVSAVPEPSTYALMLAGLLVVIWQARARFCGSNI